MRCEICGGVEAHNRLTHRNQLLLEWWPLWSVTDGKFWRVNRAEKIPAQFMREAELEVERRLNPNPLVEVEGSEHMFEWAFER